MTQFKVGDRVRFKSSGQEGVVERIGENILFLSFEGNSALFTVWPNEIEIAKPVHFYLLLVDGMDTIWSRHNTLEEARKAGNDLLVAGNSEKGVSVLRVIEYGKLPAREIEWRKIE